MASEEKKAEGTPQAGANSLQGRGAAALAYLPGKFAELKTFMSDVRSELRRVTWPAKSEVYPTTIVVIVTTIIFGVLLWAVDIVFSKGLAALMKQV